eukprot:jgi/Galph1/81/GphlegSOOS_G4874.1
MKGIDQVIQQRPVVCFTSISGCHFVQKYSCTSQLRTKWSWCEAAVLPCKRLKTCFWKNNSEWLRQENKRKERTLQFVWEASSSSTTGGSPKDDNEGNDEGNREDNANSGGNSGGKGPSHPFSAFGGWLPFRGDSNNKDKNNEDPNKKEGGQNFNIPGFGFRNNNANQFPGVFGSALSSKQLDISSALAAYNQEEKNELLDFIDQVPPSELVSRFLRKSPKDVQNAIRINLVQLLGSLPPGLFQTSIRTLGVHLMQLMESCLMTGYMLRNAQYRYSLSKSLEPVEDQKKLLQGQQPIVRGKVSVQNPDGTVTEVDTSEYVEELRSQVTQLERELERYKNSSGSQLLSYIRTMDHENVEALTRDMGDDVIDAMKQIIRAITSQTSIAQNPMSVVETNTNDLSQMLFWLLVTGYFLREAEVQQSLHKLLES